MPLRQMTVFFESLLRLVGLDWDVPDYSTLCRRQKTVNVSLLIDSTGIKTEGEGEWNARKHGDPKKRVWRKGIPRHRRVTLKVRAVEVTVSNVGDAPMLAELLAQVPLDQVIGSVTTGGACDTPKYHDAIASMMPTSSSHRVKTPSPGNLRVHVPSPETKRSTPHDICAKASWRGTLIDRSLKLKSCRRAESLHSYWHTRCSGRGISLSAAREGSAECAHTTNCATGPERTIP